KMDGGKRGENAVRARVHHRCAALGHDARTGGRVHDGRGVQSGVANADSAVQRPEKAFVVYLVLVNVSEPYAQGLKIGAAMDATVVLYTIAYFGVYGFKSSPK